MSSNPGTSSNKEDTSQSARPRPVLYTETTGAEAGQGVVQPIQPKDTNGMANVNAKLQRKLPKWEVKSETTIG